MGHDAVDGQAGSPTGDARLGFEGSRIDLDDLTKRYQGLREVAPLHVVRMELGSPRPTPYHPEDVLRGSDTWAGVEGRQVASVVEEFDGFIAPGPELLGSRGDRLSDVRPEFGGRRIASIDWLEVELFVASLVERGLSPKTESGICTIPIPEWLIEQLAASLAARAEAPGVRPSGTDRMFVSPTGKPMYDHTLWRIVHNAQVAADLPRLGPDDLRHTHASLLIDLDALVERTRQPGPPDPSTVAITRSK